MLLSSSLSLSFLSVSPPLLLLLSSLSSLPLSSSNQGSMSRRDSRTVSSFSPLAFTDIFDYGLPSSLSRAMVCVSLLLLLLVILILLSLSLSLNRTCCWIPHHYLE
jgi:hypothetical protein